MSQVQQTDPEAAPPETNDNGTEPVMSKSSDHSLRLQLHSPPHHLELPSSPLHSPPPQLGGSSPPLQLGSSPHHSPPLQLGGSSPPLRLRSSPHHSPNESPSSHHSPSSYQSQSPNYSPTLHQSLSPSPPNSPPLQQTSSPRHSPPHQFSHETRDDDNFYGAPEPSTSEGAAGLGAYQNPEPVTTPVPTKVDAYKHRGIRSNRLHMLNIANVSLRAFTAVFTLIAFSLIASNKETLVVNLEDSLVLHFHDLFYLSYLLTANVITFTYVVVTMGIFMYHMTSQKPFENMQLILGVFALDQILSYLLMSASSSAATGIRAQRRFITGSALDSFESQAYAGVAMSFVAFFLLAVVSLISGHRLVHRRHSSF